MRHRTLPGPSFDAGPRARTDAIDRAVDLAVLAPSVHNTQPWLFEVRADRLLIRADRSRQLTVLDPLGRELVQSVGAALLTARASLAADGWATEMHRLPEPDDPDLLAVVEVLTGAPDEALAALAPAAGRRRTNRRAFADTPVPEPLVRALAADAAAEGVQLVPVLTEEHRRLVARLTQQADELQNARPAYRAELRHWTTRSIFDGDGVPPQAVPRVDGSQHDDLPIRDFDTRGTGTLPAETASGTGQTLLLLATAADDPRAWLHCGEALQRVLLALTAAGWAASPLTQAVEEPLTRTQLRSALAWYAHPQMLLRVGSAAPTPPAPRRRRGEVVACSR
jgi:nitroreductase